MADPSTEHACRPAQGCLYEPRSHQRSATRYTQPAADVRVQGCYRTSDRIDRLRSSCSRPKASEERCRCAIRDMISICPGTAPIVPSGCECVDGYRRRAARCYLSERRAAMNRRNSLLTAPLDIAATRGSSELINDSTRLC